MSLPTFQLPIDLIQKEGKESKLTKKSRKRTKFRLLTPSIKTIHPSLIGKSSKVDTPMSLPQQSSVSLPGQAARWSVFMFMMILIYIALCLAQNFIPPCQIQGSCWMTRTLGLTIRLHPTLSRCHYGVLFSG